MNAVSLQHLQSDALALHTLRRIHPGAPASLCYRRASRVSSSLRQAIAFQAAASRADFAVRPLLQYYELVHGMKALLYLCDLQYPKSASVLQHGLSVRRTKRDVYHWPLESVYVQKDGILQAFAATFAPRLALPQRFVVAHLLHQLPSTQSLVAAFWANVPPAPVRFPHEVEDDAPDTPDWLIHFVLLFTLASLCRYNALEWSDILMWNHEVDALLVRAYLESCAAALDWLHPVFSHLAERAF
ncbi:MAG: hypothetical protein IRZ33_11420 [Alicyclobacillaceae bacterium]|nr:hypothetical protein [Alicyclobacillaceae bacterium]